MAVNPNYQRQGIGSMMLRGICDEADRYKRHALGMYSHYPMAFHCTRNLAVRPSVRLRVLMVLLQACFGCLDDRIRGSLPVDGVQDIN